MKKTAKQLINQKQKKLDEVQKERNLEDAQVALRRAIEDKEKELRDHELEEDNRVLDFIKTQDPNLLIDAGKKQAIIEDLEDLKRIQSERFPES